KFIESPDTVDFIAQNSVFFRDYIRDKPYIFSSTELVGGYLLAYVNRDKLNSVIMDLGSAFVTAESKVLGLLGRQALESAGIMQVQQQPFLDLRGQGVIIGIIDTGIDYTLNTFRYEDGTSKIISVYDQTARGSYPYDFNIGVEYTREQINEALKSENPFSIVPQTDTVGHGTFLASVAAGRQNDEYIGAAPDSELIIVKLRKARPYYLEKYLIPPEQENAYESSAVMLGVEYIIRKSREIGRPAAICIGLGTSFGGHDGFSLLEEYYSEVSKITGICICIAAGNESQARHHFGGILTEGGEDQRVELRVGGVPGSVYITMWNNESDRFSVSIISPTGEIVGRVPAKAGSRYESRLILERSTVIIEYYFPERGSGAQNTVIKIIDATPGIWTVVVHGDIVLSGEFHMWLPITGFVTPGIEFVTPSPNYTVTMPSTAIGPIAIGAYNPIDNSIYAFSSWGPTRLPIAAPDLTAPGVGVSGIYPGGTGTMDGTSVATAIATGAAALMLQWGIVNRNDIAMSTFQIRAYFIRGASRTQGFLYPNSQWGFGRLNLMQTFQSMIQE
ncbi:MAG TPA: peptidase, partial [Clostridiales bacterium]|nr:peptidase [Clostridiales bacterium]